MQPNQRPPSFLRIFLILIGISATCIGTIMIVADVQCNTDIEAWIPLYPDAETVSVRYDLFRARGMGSTELIQHTDDDPETARQYYRDHVIDMMDIERARGLALTDWQVEPDTESGGSLVYLRSTCGLR